MSSNIPPASETSQGAPGRSSRPAAVTTDELLPPIEPPSARFFIQLFVTPAIIVAGVVLVWFVIESLARRGAQDPEEIVRALRSNNQARFQKAKDLADMLRTPQRYPELRTNRKLAQELSKLLDELVTAGDDADSAVSMRIFLGMALGEFHVDEGLPVLLRMARDDPERDVRRRAINAIAVLAGGLAGLKPPQHVASDELIETLEQLTDDQDDLIRSETAYALGVVAAGPQADPRLTAALEELAEDLYIDARFNAALGLSRVGSSRAAAALAEIFDAEALQSSAFGEQQMTEEVTVEQLRQLRTYKRDLILGNAMREVSRLLENKKLTPDDRTALDEAVSALLKEAPGIEKPAPLQREAVAELKRLQSKLQSQAPSQVTRPDPT